MIGEFPAPCRKRCMRRHRVEPVRTFFSKLPGGVAKLCLYRPLRGGSGRYPIVTDSTNSAGSRPCISRASARNRFVTEPIPPNPKGRLKWNRFGERQSPPPDRAGTASCGSGRSLTMRLACTSGPVEYLQASTRARPADRPSHRLEPSCRYRSGCLHPSV